jgi:RsiW-degrading membrane proteinase PrsW (M82 family)
LHRIGFLVDAAIFGFTVGSGFAVIENLYYLEQVPDAGRGTWIVRGRHRDHARRRYRVFAVMSRRP